MAEAVTLAQRREMFEAMILIRFFEEEGERLSVRGRIPGGIHPAIGQEAVAVGVMSALGAGDVICGTHRSHHLALARGLDPGLTMAELYGRLPGVVGGRGGSMHLADFARGFYGSNGIVGAGVGIAMGAALGIRMRGDENVAVGFVGEGGLNTGRLWESVNLAVVWSLPLIVVVENNLYAVETTSIEFTGGRSAVKRAEGFGIVAESIDGQDVECVRASAEAARRRAIAGDGPSLIEAVTYRFSGHGSGERAGYRTKGEIDINRQTRDPITLYRTKLVGEGVLSDDEFGEIESSARSRVEDAIVFAEAAPWPDVKSGVGGVGWDE